MKISRRLVWRLYATYLIVVLLSTAAVGINATGWVMPHVLRSAERELGEKNRMVAPRVLEVMQNNGHSLQQVVQQIGSAGNTRVTLIDLNGTVLADSQQRPAVHFSHAHRPEFLQAMRGKTGTARRSSATVKVDMMYVAMPLTSDGEIVAVLRSAMPLTEIDEATAYVYRRVITGAVVVAVIAAIIGLLLSLTISRPIEQIAAGARRFSQGNLEGRILAGGYAEADVLAESLNTMALQLDQRIHSLQSRQKELQAVLAGMSEGLLAVDSQQRIMLLNDAARQMLQVHVPQPTGRTLAEAVRQASFQQFVNRAFAADTPVEDEIALQDDVIRIVRLHAGALFDEHNRRVGLVVVLSDITHLRKLEQMRKDFVANVSHELKTPVTSIRGFVETLRDGAMDDPKKGPQFLDIVGRQAERLEMIIDDLLSLSRIEQDAENSRIEMRRVAVADVAKGATAACQQAAAEKQVTLQTDCQGELAVRANAQLLEQALINLLQNAIRYSPARSIVLVQAQAQEDGVAISVIDYGCGISQEHLPRIFERFYCVDKARSRNSGGTGLGLAIVKHIVQAHAGRVSVRSTVGQGSTFTLHLPSAR